MPQSSLQSKVVQAISQTVSDNIRDESLLFHAIVDVPKHVVLKNSKAIYRNRKTGKYFIGKSAVQDRASQYLTVRLKEQALLQRLYSPIVTPVWVIMHFYFDDYFTKKGEVSKNLPDLSNLYQLPEDCLQDAGILFDDNLIFSHDLSRRLHGEKTFLEIFILRYAE